MLKNDGLIIMRCHPWCSRHGGHLYHQKNKAFIHLVFSDDELRKLGIHPDKSIRKVTQPRIYKEWIEECGLKIVSEDIIKTSTEDFFHHSLITQRINQSCNRLPEQELALSVLDQSFIDYTLKK